jgi:alkaline phosphatase
MIKRKKIIAYFIAASIVFSNCNSGTKVAVEKVKKPLNIILMIGDGMGLAQISAAIVVNGGLNLEFFKDIGFVKTSSSDDYITDSAAGATAYSTGVKTYNGAIGVGPDTMSLQTIIELAESNNLATGLISTCSITHATPASFYAHQKNREMHNEIANDFYGKGVDFIAGTGKPYFDMEKLKLDQYWVHTNQNDSIFDVNKKHFWFFNDSIHPPKYDLRGDWLNYSTSKGIEYLSRQKKGFFLMVEGSQIDWGGHNNDIQYTVNELIDFDKAIKTALDFAIKDGNTLLIITADHETGGLALDGGNLKNKEIIASFSSKHHSGVMVPIFAFGPGSENFKGIMENTDVYFKMKTFLKLK